MILSLILLLSIAFLLIILSMVWPPDSPWAPWWKTDKKIAQAACTLAKITNKDLVYELGSGEGTFLRVAAKEFRARGVGLEIDPLRYLISTLMIYIIKASGRVTIKRKNFFDEDLSKADVVFVYLVPKALEKLKPKFLSELKPGTRIISYKYEMDLPLIKEDKKNKLRLFRI